MDNKEMSVLTLTVKELKDVFKNNKWKFIKKEKADTEVKSTEQFVFEKKVRTKRATVWLSFNSLNDVKEYFYDIELSNSKTNAYNSYGNVSDIYKSIQDVVKELNENFEEFE